MSIAAEARAETPAEAQQLAAEAMTTAQAALATVGLAADAIRTTGYSLRPNMQYQQGRSTILGYIANNQIDLQGGGIGVSMIAPPGASDAQLRQVVRVSDNRIDDALVGIMTVGPQKQEVVEVNE